MLKYHVAFCSVVFLFGCANPKKGTETTPAKTEKKQAAQTNEKSQTKTPEAKKPMNVKLTKSGSGGIGDVMQCQSGQDKRTLEIIEKDGGCEVMYQKFGESKSAATAKNGKEYCSKIQAQIRGKLEAAGFNCTAE